MNKRNLKNTVIYVVVLAILIVGVMSIWNMMGQQEEKLEYYQVVQYFRDGKVKEYKLNLASGELQFWLRDDKDTDKDKKEKDDTSSSGSDEASGDSSGASDTASGITGGFVADDPSSTLPDGSESSTAEPEDSSGASSADSSQAASEESSQKEDSSKEESSSKTSSEEKKSGGLFGLNLNNKKEDKDKGITYKIPNVGLFLESISESVETYNDEHPDSPIQYDYEPGSDNSWLWNILPMLILVVLMVVFFVYMMKQTGAGGGKISQFGKANLKQTMQNGRKTTFAEVAGADEEKEELSEIVEFLKNPSRFNDLGARIPKGVLLIGPPGTGKTLLARAVAGEAGVPFFSISGSDFVEMFVGVGASRVRDLFDQAKKNAPAIIFIDEIDAVGRQRGTGLGGGHDEREQTLNQMLVEMDGFGANEGIIVIAATNRRDILDPALLRPGRFDRQVYVGYPDVKGREEILKVHSRNKPLGFDVDLGVIARSTAGFTGADLENLMNEAALLAARKNHKAITAEDIEEATIKVVAGPEKKSRVINEKERRLTAYHEAGHAVSTYYCKTQDPVHQISIIPRGMAGGYTMSLPEDDASYIVKNQMQENIVTLLGGRIAESLILDDISTGASNDLERASDIARKMVTRYGFSEKLGPVVYGESDHEVFLGRDFSNNRNFSEDVAAEIDKEVRRIIDAAYTQCESILKEHMDQLHLVAQYLIRHEKVDAAEFKKLMTGQITMADMEQYDREQAEKKKQKEAEKAEQAKKTGSAENSAAPKQEEAKPAEDAGVKESSAPFAEADTKLNPEENSSGQIDRPDEAGQEPHGDDPTL